jgi:hypothetical protein
MNAKRVVSILCDLKEISSDFESDRQPWSVRRARKKALCIEKPLTRSVETKVISRWMLSTCHVDKLSMT